MEEFGLAMASAIELLFDPMEARYYLHMVTFDIRQEAIVGWNTNIQTLHMHATFCCQMF